MWFVGRGGVGNGLGRMVRNTRLELGEGGRNVDACERWALGWRGLKGRGMGEWWGRGRMLSESVVEGGEWSWRMGECVSCRLPRYFSLVEIRSPRDHYLPP